MLGFLQLNTVIDFDWSCCQISDLFEVESLDLKELRARKMWLVILYMTKCDGR